MIQLYGLRLSNYYNLAKALLIEKGLDFEEIKARPTQEEDNLSRSPMGKMPSISVNGQFMSESLAIAAYLDRLEPQPALLPPDPFEAGKVIELICHIKLDVELVARRCLPETLFNQPVSEEIKQSTQDDLAKGMKAVSRIFVGQPFAAGTTLTLADFYTFYCFDLATTITHKMFGEDLLASHPDIRNVIEHMAQHPSVARVESERAKKG